jgi:hypothetical protein
MRNITNIYNDLSLTEYEALSMMMENSGGR